MGLDLLEKINRKKEEAGTVARIVATANSARAIENFNQIKGKNYNKSTFYRRHGLGEDDAQRNIVLVEFANDFYANGFAHRPNARILTDYVLSLNDLLDENKLPRPSRSPWEVRRELNQLIEEYTDALAEMNKEKASRVVVLIEQKTKELGDATNNPSAFCLGVA